MGKIIIQIFGVKKCKDTRKAERYFGERRIETQFIDLTQKGVSPGELKSMVQSNPLEDLIDTEGKRYHKRNLKYMKYDIFEELLEDPLLLKTPIVRCKGRAIIGYCPDLWKQLIEDEN